MTLSQAFLLTVKKQKECRARVAVSPISVILGVGVISLFLIFGNRFDSDQLSSFGFMMVFLLVFSRYLFKILNHIEKVEKAKEEYNEFYKEVFIPALIKDIDESFTYSAYGGISQSEFNAAGIYRPSTFYSEDSVRGVYKGVKFNLCEIY